MSEGPVARPWVAVASERALDLLAPLAEAHASRGPVALLRYDGPGSLSVAVRDAGSVLFVGDRRRGPRTSLPGPVLHDGGRAVPVGWLPEDDELSRAVDAMATVALRRGPAGPLLLLAGRVPRSRLLLEEVEDIVTPTTVVHRWDADRVTRRRLLPGLHAGAGCALYSGHGTHRGWLAYGGVRPTDLGGARPLGAVLSLACHGCSRRRVRRSFAEEVVANAAAAAVLAPVGTVEHVDHIELARHLARCLRDGAGTVGELMAHPGFPARCLGHYRIVGDPGALLVGAVGAAAATRAVPAPAPHEEPPPLPGWRAATEESERPVRRTLNVRSSATSSCMSGEG